MHIVSKLSLSLPPIECNQPLCRTRNRSNRSMNFIGLVTAVATFLIIGIFHPLVIKAEYYWGVKCWWLFLLAGVGSIAGSLFMVYASIVGHGMENFWYLIVFAAVMLVGRLFIGKKR